MKKKTWFLIAGLVLAAAAITIYIIKTKQAAK